MSKFQKPGKPGNYTFNQFMPLFDLIGACQVIVEGNRDKGALRNLGIKDVVCISGKPYHKLLERLKRSKPVLVLTDFDFEGKKMSGKISHMLEHSGFKVDVGLRRRFYRETRIARIEDLSKNKLGDDFHGKIATINDKILNRSRDRS